MSSDYLTLGSTPCGEDCAQVGTEEYHLRSLLECKAYVRQLQQQFGDPLNSSCWYGVKSFPHDFGSYHEVVIYFDDENEQSVDFAYNVESNIPEYWLDEFRPTL